MTDGRLADEDVRDFHRRTRRWVFRLWAGSVAILLGVIIWFLKARQLDLAHVPPAVTFVVFKVLLFPGSYIAAVVALKLGITPGMPASGLVTPLEPRTFLLVVLLGGLVVNVIFWALIVPWVLTALRVYVWPGRGYGHEA